MIIVIGGEKGGTGKSTIATNLAQMRTARGKDALLVDTDKQETSCNWASLREENEITPTVKQIEKTGKNIVSNLQDLAEKYDDLIIDTGGRDTPELRASLLVADCVYIPVQASQFDIWSLETMEEILSQCSVMNPTLKAFTVINRASTNPSVSEVGEAENIVSNSEIIPFSGAILRERIVYRKAQNSGQGIEEMKPQDPKAIAEIQNLYSLIFE